ncbi:MAG: oxidoreductase [Pseudomonadota bacterium]|nr:oxidoreductase [Pseudomonadota bacterium]
MATQWTTADIPPQNGRIAVVTGANSGLGLQTATALAAAGAQVIMACRNPDKAAAALDQVKRHAPDAKVQLMTLDLADLRSIRAFAAAFSQQFKQLDLLVNNAGVMALPFSRTRDGFEMQIGTNHFGHFALTGLLMDRLIAGKQPRIVNVASMAHNWTPGLNFDDLNYERRKYNKWIAYGNSKLSNLYFTFELNRRINAAGKAITVAAAHPGYSDTNLQYAGPALEKSAFGTWLMKVGNGIFAQPAELGALPSLYAATAPDVNGGDYIGPDGFQQIRGYPRKVGCRKLARDTSIAQRLWAVSEELTDVKYALS